MSIVLLIMNAEKLLGALDLGFRTVYIWTYGQLPLPSKLFVHCDMEWCVFSRRLNGKVNPYLWGKLCSIPNTPLENDNAENAWYLI